MHGTYPFARAASAESNQTSFAESILFAQRHDGRWYLSLFVVPTDCDDAVRGLELPPQAMATAATYPTTNAVSVPRG